MAGDELQDQVRRLLIRFRPTDLLDGHTCAFAVDGVAGLHLQAHIGLIIGMRTHIAIMDWEGSFVHSIGGFREALYHCPYPFGIDIALLILPSFLQIEDDRH